MAKLFGLIVIAAVLWMGSVSVAQEDPGVTGPVPWVSNIQGADGSFLVKQPDTDWFEGSVNTPLGEGDLVWQEASGRSELYIDRGTWVRLDHQSGLQFDRLSDDQVRMTLTRGRVMAGCGLGRELLVDLPGQTAILGPGDRALIEVSENGESVVEARKGRVQVDGPRGQVRVDAGQRLVTDEDGEIGRLERAQATGSFETYSDARDREFGAASGPPTTVVNYLPEPVALDLSVNGIWTNDAEYGYVWQPRVAVGWTPYRAGRWIYRPVWGWTWVSYEPWGWYPYHYGRWVERPVGWVWVPVRARSAWSPALVFWIEGPDYIAWQPLPVNVTVAMAVGWSPVMVERHICSRCITSVRYQDFGRGNYHRYVRPWPGDCRGSCQVVRAPGRVISRPADYNVYRTPRLAGFVVRSRAPREQAVYVHHRSPGSRPTTYNQGTRVHYGTGAGRIPCHPGPGQSPAHAQ